MIRTARRFWCCVLLVESVVSGEDFPETMTKLSVRFESPSVPEASFASKPKVMYRAGKRYCRTEEMPDPERSLHGLTIINEPDIWMINLFPKTARHFVDPGPTFNCRMPIFIYGEEVETVEDMKNLLLELEFGHELEYFKGKNAATNKGPVLRGAATTAYSVKVGGSQLFLFTISTPERPWAVIRQHSKTREIYWYGEFKQVPFDSQLFAKPIGVEIEEVGHLWNSPASTK